MTAPGPWDWCPCGHLLLLHDVEDMDGTNPTCCAESCNQDGCGTPAVVVRVRDRVAEEAVAAVRPQIQEHLRIIRDVFPDGENLDEDAARKYLQDARPAGVPCPLHPPEWWCSRCRPPTRNLT